MIIPAGERTTEHEMEAAIVAFLTTCAYGEAPFNRKKPNNLFFGVQQCIQLTPKDREVSTSRDAEQKWHMTVRNVYRSGIRHGLFVKLRGGGLKLASKVKKKE